MPKVLRIINRFNLGGPTYNVAYLSKFMDPEFETMLVGGMKDETEDSSQFITAQLGLEPHIIPEMHREIKPYQDYIAFQKICELIRNYQPQIVHTHASKAGTLGRLAAHQMGVPIILHTFHGHVFHSYFGSLKTAFYKSIERYLAQRSTKIIAISDLQKQEIAVEHRICKPDKVKVIPLGFDLSRFREDQDIKRKHFREQYALEENEIAIGIVGRMVPIKNHELFLKGVQHLLRKGVEHFRAFIIGDGETREMIMAEAEELNIPFTDWNNPTEKKPLTFTSWHREVDKVYAGLDIVALTSLNEGTPVSLIEAQAANKPIISTNVGGIENVVVPNKTALLSPVDNEKLFFENLAQLVQNSQMRQEMGALGWGHVKEKFHYARLVNDMKSLYHQLLEENKVNNHVT